MVPASDRERRQGCARGAVVGHSGVPSLVAARLVLAASVRPSDRRDAFFERGEGSGKIRMDARGSVDYFIGGDRGEGRGRERGRSFFTTGKRESIFRGEKRGSPLSCPGTRNRLFPFFAEKKKERTQDKSAGPLSRTGSWGTRSKVSPGIDVYRVYSARGFHFLCIFGDGVTRVEEEGEQIYIYKIVTVPVETMNSNFLSDFFDKVFI